MDERSNSLCLTRWDNDQKPRGPRLSRARRISRIFPNSSIFRSGYLRAQEELEARPTCFLKLKTSSFELCKHDSRGVFAKIRKSAITTTTNRKISFHTPIYRKHNEFVEEFLCFELQIDLALSSEGVCR